MVHQKYELQGEINWTFGDLVQLGLIYIFFLAFLFEYIFSQQTGRQAVNSSFNYFLKNTYTYLQKKMRTCVWAFFLLQTLLQHDCILFKRLLPFIVSIRILNHICQIKLCHHRTHHSTYKLRTSSIHPHLC